MVLKVACHKPGDFLGSGQVLRCGLDDGEDLAAPPHQVEENAEQGFPASPAEIDSIIGRNAQSPAAFSGAFDNHGLAPLSGSFLGEEMYGLVRRLDRKCY